MTKQEWQKIAAARKTLGLKERASVEEIRQVYRQLAKKNHPDLAADPEAAGKRMHELIDAYRVLLDYGARYQLPLRPDAGDMLEDEDWWMNRFGCDPLWGRGDKKD
jgi:preprotein translocase subunit Sec63